MRWAFMLFCPVMLFAIKLTFGWLVSLYKCMWSQKSCIYCSWFVHDFLLETLMPSRSYFGWQVTPTIFCISTLIYVIDFGFNQLLNFFILSQTCCCLRFFFLLNLFYSKCTLSSLYCVQLLLQHPYLSFTLGGIPGVWCVLPSCHSHINFKP